MTSIEVTGIVYRHNRPSRKDILGGPLCITVIPEDTFLAVCSCGVFQLVKKENEMTTGEQA